MIGKLEKEKLYMPVAIVVVAAAIFFLGSSLVDPASKVITTSTTMTEKVSPDKVEVTFGFESDGKTAAESQTANREVSNKIIETVSGYGVLPENVKTIQYNVEPIKNYNLVTGKTESGGFKTTHIVTVTLTGELNMDNVGPMIDAVVADGANRVDNIVFSLDRWTEEGIKDTLLFEAALESRTKAASIATGLGTRISGVKSASESSFYITPFFAKAAESSDSGSTQVQRGQIEVSASVTASFEIA